MSLGQGVVGEQPSLHQIKSVLSEWDAYMYCGHGGNLKNVPSQVPISQKYLKQLITVGVILNVKK
jgi:hypothetical protein